MKISVLASGSKGNCTYLEHHNTKILIDLGIPLLYLKKKLKELNTTIDQIDAVILTHTHIDHVSGLATFCRNNDTKVYITPGMENDIKDLVINYIIIKEATSIIKEITIKTIPTSHDANDSVGFIITTGTKEMVYITDTGYINQRHFSKLKNKDIYVIESNHDIEMLMTGSYPYHLKQRILSDEGHLSNQDSARYLSKLVGPKTKCIVLAHLSEENNTAQLARQTLTNTLAKSDKKVAKIVIAKQHDKTELIEV